MLKQQKSINTLKTGIEIVEKLVAINRVSKTVKGGKNMSFAALVVVGDKSGRVGFGKGSATEVSDAKNKAFEAAKRSMIKIHLKENRTIHHDIFTKFCSAKVYLRSASAGTGVIAGAAVRAVMDVCGIKDIRTKCIGSKTAQNVLRATLAGLLGLDEPEVVAAVRGLKLEEMGYHPF
jgi:small subunit ribosomal protein S5